MMRKITASSIIYTTTSMKCQRPSIQNYSTNVYLDRRKASYQVRLNALLRKAEAEKIAQDASQQSKEWNIFKTEINLLVGAQPPQDRRRT